ncbi:ABC transporter permease [Leucobacter sp. UT-8R-CII-1-4]|uniref:ABC transporter permease n=1 Tax=Leucobacter sp. UT-8R-CII-1-4 TaxID=3040075 RepID=UPI0024A822C1|nr:ABC transporter permease [Leucobacter sp. UT-8R-CII-1-4]MDI6023411.1 ABC transporter permease [Leucobacter sp. UT-8R-CII-1-4]
MLRSLVTRLLSSVLVFLVIAIGLFTLVRLAPGDPVDMMVPPEIAGEDRVAYTAAVRERLGLDQALPVQFMRWFGGLLTGDLGYSYSSGAPVSGMLADRIGPTMLLMGSALVIGLIIAVPAGVITAMRRGTIVDQSISTVSVVAIAIPSFFSAMLLIYIFAVKLRVLPSAGMYTSGRGDLGDLILHMVLPVSLLALTVAAPFTRYVRSGMLEELNKDYVRAVVAKGARPSLAMAHALRNSLISLVTVVALYIPVFLAGAVVVEQVFAWPGMGQLAIKALSTRDYPVIIGFGLYVAVLVLVCNFVADMLYAVVDPRVRMAKQ